jgi:hypothetical protein
MKKKKKAPRVKVKPEVMAKSMKKQLGEFHAQRVVRDLVNSLKNVAATDINLKDIFNLDDLKRDRQFWEQVHGILGKTVK